MPSFLPAAFLSYAHRDNDEARGGIIDLADQLVCKVEELSGKQVGIFYDRGGLEWGENWRARVEETLGAVTFLIPVFTPRYFQSRDCLRELDSFASKLSERGSDRLILPLYYRPCDILDKALSEDKTAALSQQISSVLGKPAADSIQLARLVIQSQFHDWRQLRLLGLQTPRVKTAIGSMAVRITEVLQRQHQVDVVIPVGPLDIDRQKMPLYGGIKLLSLAGNRYIGEHIFGQLATFGNRIRRIYLLMALCKGSEQWNSAEDSIVKHAMGYPDLAAKIKLVASGKSKAFPMPGLRKLDLTPWFLLHYSDVWPKEGSSLYQDLLEKKERVNNSCMGILACSDSAPSGFLTPGVRLSSNANAVGMVAKPFHILEVLLPNGSRPRFANMAIALLKREVLETIGDLRLKGELFGIVSELCSKDVEFQPLVHRGIWYHCDTESDCLIMQQRSEYV